MSGKQLYPLGRLHAPDLRDQAHLMRTAMAPAVGPLPAYRYWTPGPVLDQGQHPFCVAFAWTGWEISSPVRDKLAAIDTPDNLYAQAQAIDEWAGTPHDGTSVRAGAKIMQREGRIGEYVWATNANDIATWLLTKGPVVLGTNWYAEMFTPAEGVVHVGGELAGGHAYLAIGYSSHAQMFRCVNSWSKTWGENGRFWLTMPDMQRLMHEDGEACAAVEVAI